MEAIYVCDYFDLTKGERNSQRRLISRLNRSVKIYQLRLKISRLLKKL